MTIYCCQVPQKFYHNNQPVVWLCEQCEKPTYFFRTNSKTQILEIHSKSLYVGDNGDSTGFVVASDRKVAFDIAKGLYINSHSNKK